jgi:hypothetical protein
VGLLSKQKKAVILLTILVLGGIFVTLSLHKSDSELLAQSKHIKNSMKLRIAAASINTSVIH